MTKYNQTFKQQVVDFYFQHEESLSLTCRTFTVSKRTLRYWNRVLINVVVIQMVDE
ncbi:transposase [Gallibacterium anatis]|uniref:transposase n=1 Tax=Gallibacterium anatis TaxID=750 RepID=UPI0022311E14|nr:transposase [Gallibacterium anatis]UZD17091.1 transposase [Gallibacterium anatis]